MTTDSDEERIVEAAIRNPKKIAKEIRKDLGLSASRKWYASFCTGMVFGAVRQ